MHALTLTATGRKPKPVCDKRDTRYRTAYVSPPGAERGYQTYNCRQARKKLASFPAFRHGSPKVHVPAPVRLMVME